VGAYCLRRASAIVTYNRDIFARLNRMGRTDTRFVRNGIATTFSSDDTAIGRRSWCALRAALDLPADRPVVLFAGRFVAKKGLDLIRGAASEMTDCSFVMCGSGPIDPHSWNLANVRVVGPVNHDVLKQYFGASDLLLLPSKGEGFPLVIPEAMACGLPCAILRETWETYGEPAEHFELLTEASISDGLRAFLGSSPNFDRRRGIAAFARERWNWDSAVDQYLDLYASLCQPRRGANGG
jgi:glycosyltransferase involved in cell wall biosynthesis